MQTRVMISNSYLLHVCHLQCNYHKFGSQVLTYMYSPVSGYQITCSVDLYLSKLPLFSKGFFLNLMVLFSVLAYCWASNLYNQSTRF